jgi:hypothetical protein
VLEVAESVKAGPRPNPRERGQDRAGAREPVGAEGVPRHGHEGKG